MVEQCYKRHKTNVNPIIDWIDEDVWGFIKAHGIHYCRLYDEGFNRIGCIGCPMASTKEREKEFLRWGKYKDSYFRAFDMMIKERDRKGIKRNSWETAKDVFNWWMGYDVLQGQMEFEEIEEYE